MWKNQEKRKLVQIPADEIRPNRAQPRHTFDEDGLRSLAESIKQNGLLQPVCVRKVVGGYELIAGERRLRACRMAGMKAIPCLVSGCDARQSAVLALLENLQRRDLNLFEEAEGLRRLVEEWGVTQEEAAERLGRSQSAVANKLRLLRFTPEERAQILDAGLTERHARALLRLEDPARRAAALQLVVERGLNVAQTETYLRQLMGEESPAEKPKRTVLVRDVRIFVNTIRHAVDLMKQNGIRAESEWTETDDYLEYVVKIPRREGERRRAARTP